MPIIRSPFSQPVRRPASLDRDVQPVEPVELPSMGIPKISGLPVSTPRADVPVGGDSGRGVPAALIPKLSSAQQQVWESGRVSGEERQGILDRLKNIASGVSPVSKVQQLLPDFIADPVESAQDVVKRGVAGALEYPKRAVQAFVDEAAESKTEGPTPLPFNPLTFDYGDWWDKVQDEEYNIDIRPVQGLTGSTGRAARYTDNVVDFVAGEILLDPWTYSTLGAG